MGKRRSLDFSSTEQHPSWTKLPVAGELYRLYDQTLDCYTKRTADARWVRGAHFSQNTEHFLFVTKCEQNKIIDHISPSETLVFILNGEQPLICRHIFWKEAMWYGRLTKISP